MHYLLQMVLNGKDLSKAGDLFSLPDKLIMNDLSAIISKIQEIISSHGYIQNFNDQSVVEICIARVTSTLRDTNCIEDHIEALVNLLKTCLNYDLKPLGKEIIDTPHAKIASDVLASVFLNYAKRHVMRLALPTAVKFLHKGNKELCRNVTSYLPLAAIEFPDLLVHHIQPIIDSVISGNYTLTRILPQIYILSQERINEHIMSLANLLQACDDFETNSLLSLFKLVASSNSSTITNQLLEPSLSQLMDCLNRPTSVNQTLEVFLEMCKSSRLVQDRMDEISDSVTASANVVPNACVTAAEIFSKIGVGCKDKSAKSLDNMIHLLRATTKDTSVQTQIIREIITLAECNPSILNSGNLSIIEKYSMSLNSITQGVGRIDKLKDLLNRRSNNITVVKINQSQNSSSSEFLKLPATTTSSSSSIANINLRSSNFGPRLNALSSPTSRFITTEYIKRPPSNMGNSITRLHALLGKQGGNAYHNHASNIKHQGIYSGHSSQQHTSLNKLNQFSSIHQSKIRNQNNYSVYNNRITLNRDDHHSPATFSSSSGLVSPTTIPVNSVHVNTGGNASGSINYNTIMIGNNNNTSILGTPQPSFPNYFLGTSVGTMSSSTSVLSNMNNNMNSSRLMSSSQLNHNANSNSTMFKELPSPVSYHQDPTTTTNINIPSAFHQHQSQPELRHSNVIQISSNHINTRSQHSQHYDTINENNRVSVFEPFPMRDTVQHFCEKHLDKIKAYMQKVCVRLPLPSKCTIERKSKKMVKLHFSCQFHTDHCLYKTTHYFTLKTRSPRVWIHIMFLALQARSSTALSTREASVSSLKNCWDTLASPEKTLKAENKSFLTLVTSAFPSSKEQDTLMMELRNNGYFDVFEFNALKSSWGCFLCNHPEKALHFLSSDPIIEGCLKEKKGKWKLFQRWRTKYFTLSGGQLQARGADSSSTLSLHQIMSVRVTRGQRNIPKAFEIFTDKDSFVLKPKNGKNANEWVQCLSVLVARKDGTLSPGGITSLHGLRTAV